jgi:hypothetical protein
LSLAGRQKRPAFFAGFAAPWPSTVQVQFHAGNLQINWEPYYRRDAPEWGTRARGGRLPGGRFHSCKTMLFRYIRPITRRGFAFGSPRATHTGGSGRMRGRQGGDMVELLEFKITNRDEQILRLLMEGCSNKEIAGELHISRAP